MESKPWYASKLIWTGVAGIFTTLGVWAEAGFQMSNFITIMWPALFGVLTIVFRMVTKQPIGDTPPPPTPPA